MKEISVLKSLRGHPNVVTLYAHGILDMGRGKKEALLAMEFCGKSLVEVLESRGGGAGYFEEKQALAVFRDVCNAVFAMHCQSPRIAHRYSWWFIRSLSYLSVQAGLRFSVRLWFGSRF